MARTTDVDKKAVLRRLTVPIITDNTATGGDTFAIVTPCKCLLQDISFCCSVGVSACAGNALHTVVTADQGSEVLIDNTITGTVSAIAASAVITITASSGPWISALTRVVVNFSASSAIGIVRGVARFYVDGRDDV